MTTRKIETIQITESGRHGDDILYAGTYRIEMPADYDPSLVTAVDILADEQIVVIEDPETTPREYTTYGQVRGHCGHRHQTLDDAAHCLNADREGCASQGGYSDREIYDALEVDRCSTWEAVTDYLTPVSGV